MSYDGFEEIGSTGIYKFTGTATGSAGQAWDANFQAIAAALGGLAVGADVQAYSANLDTWSGVAPSTDGQGLVAADDYAAMRGLLSLGTMATQDADAVAITGGSIDGAAIGGATPTTGTFSQATIRQAADQDGWITYGYDDRATYWLRGNVKSNGDAEVRASNALNVMGDNALSLWSAVGYGIAIYTGGNIIVYDRVSSNVKRMEIDRGTGELSIPSDTVGLKLDAAGTTTLISNGTLATLSKPLKAAGYQSSDGTVGATADVAVAKVGGGTRTLHFKSGLYTGYTDS
jgi:hypothetical protein